MNLKVISILAFIILVTVLVNIVLARVLYSAKKHEIELQKENDNLRKGFFQIEETIKDANEKKKKLHTGNSYSDIDNATDVMSDISKKLKSKLADSTRS